MILANAMPEPKAAPENEPTPEPELQAASKNEAKVLPPFSTQLMVEPNKPVEWVGIAGLIVALLVGFGAWYEAHEAREENKVAIAAAKSQADSASKMARLALEQSKAAQKQLDWFGITDKPSINIFDVGFSYLMNGIQKGPLFFALSMKNVGRSPAFNLHIQMKYGYAQTLSDELQVIDSDEFDEAPVAQDGTISFGARTKRISWPSDQQLQAIKNKQLFLVTLFSYKFADERGPSSPLYNVCYTYTPDAIGPTATCPKGAFGQK